LQLVRAVAGSGKYKRNNRSEDEELDPRFKHLFVRLRTGRRQGAVSTRTNDVHGKSCNRDYLIATHPSSLRTQIRPSYCLESSACNDCTDATRGPDAVPATAVADVAYFFA
jgi:hypothetical protein